MKRQPPVSQVTFTPRPVRDEVSGSRLDMALFVVGLLFILFVVTVWLPGGAA